MKGGESVERTQKVSLASLAVILLFVLPSVAMAAGGGGHGAHHETSFADTYPLWKNFALYALIVLWGIKKLVSTGWPARRARILSEFEAGKAELERAQSRLEEAQKQVAHLGKEQESVQEGINQDAEREFRAAVDAAHERAARISTQATASIEAEKKALESSIRAELAAKVVESARGRLKDEISPEVDKNLRSAALGGLGELVQ
jgi:F0F1-type ATP synthase membrane subunit b/b'